MYAKKQPKVNEKKITKEKVEKLLNLVSGALDTEKIPGNAPYIDRLKKVVNSLRVYLKATDTPEVLQVQEATLNSIQKALDGCGCGRHDRELDGIEAIQANRVPPDTVMNCMDFAQMQFKTLGFTGKWLQLIGDPSSSFTTMFFGKPKMGKSYLWVDLPVTWPGITVKCCMWPMKKDWAILSKRS